MNFTILLFNGLKLLTEFLSETPRHVHLSLQILFQPSHLRPKLFTVIGYVPVRELVQKHLSICDQKARWTKVSIHNPESVELLKDLSTSSEVMNSCRLAWYTLNDVSDDPAAIFRYMRQELRRNSVILNPRIDAGDNIDWMKLSRTPFDMDHCPGLIEMTTSNCRAQLSLAKPFLFLKPRERISDVKQVNRIRVPGVDGTNWHLTG